MSEIPAKPPDDDFLLSESIFWNTPDGAISGARTDFYTRLVDELDWGSGMERDYKPIMLEYGSGPGLFPLALFKRIYDLKQVDAIQSTYIGLDANPKVVRRATKSLIELIQNYRNQLRVLGIVRKRKNEKDKTDTRLFPFSDRNINLVKEAMKEKISVIFLHQFFNELTQTLILCNQRIDCAVYLFPSVPPHPDFAKRDVTKQMMDDAPFQEVSKSATSLVKPGGKFVYGNRFFINTKRGTPSPDEIRAGFLSQFYSRVGAEWEKYWSPARGKTICSAQLGAWESNCQIWPERKQIQADQVNVQVQCFIRNTVPYEE